MIEFIGLEELKKELFIDDSELSNIEKITYKSITKVLKEDISKKFKKRNIYNESNVVDNINSFVKIRWQRKFNEPFIGEISGNLKRSIKVKYKPIKNGIVIFVDSDSPYAKIQEEGGIVRSKGKKLTIPITKRAYFTKAKKLRNTVASKRFIFKKLSNGLYKPYYMLVDKVKLPSHKYVFNSVLDNKLLNAIDKSIKVNIFK